jgi:hypothetical protein
VVRRFAFEGDEDGWLTLVPLAARRKLDVAGYKLSLAGWQALPRADREALALHPVDEEDQARAYCALLLGCASRAGVALTSLSAAERDRGRWSATQDAPAEVRARLAREGWELPVPWPQLDDEARYALWKCATPGRAGDRFADVLRALAEEQGEPREAP